MPHERAEEWAGKVGRRRSEKRRGKQAAGSELLRTTRLDETGTTALVSGRLVDSLDLRRTKGKQEENAEKNKKVSTKG
jgi:hypothetical protein